MTTNYGIRDYSTLYPPEGKHEAIFPHGFNNSLFRFRDLKGEGPAQILKKITSDTHEWDMIKAAGDCAIGLVEEVRDTSELNGHFYGFIMEEGRELKPHGLTLDVKKGYMQQLIDLVKKLHDDRNIIHGDIKPGHIIINSQN